jgi:hypothetical protein
MAAGVVGMAGAAEQTYRVDLVLDANRHKSLGFPQESASYLVVRAPGRPRPLYLCGEPKEGVVSMRFESLGAAGLAAFDKIAKGRGVLAFTPVGEALGDVDQYAAGEWLKLGPGATVTLAIRALKNLSVDDVDLAAFFAKTDERIATVKAMREKAKKGERLVLPPAVRLTVRAMADLDVQAGSGPVASVKTPVTLDIAADEVWRVRLTAGFGVAARNLGLGEGAGDLNFSCRATIYSPLPRQFRPMDVDKETEKALLELDTVVENLL